MASHGKAPGREMEQTAVWAETSQSAQPHTSHTTTRQRREHLPASESSPERQDKQKLYFSDPSLVSAGCYTPALRPLWFLTATVFPRAAPASGDGGSRDPRSPGFDNHQKNYHAGPHSLKILYCAKSHRSLLRQLQTCVLTEGCGQQKV